MINIKRMMDNIELYCGVSGVVNQRIPERILLRVINDRLNDFAEETKISETSATISSVANQQEYELPLDWININKVLFDGYKAYHIRHADLEDLTEEVS